MTATSDDPAAFCRAGPLLISVTSPVPIIPQRIVISRYSVLAAPRGSSVMSGYRSAGRTVLGCVFGAAVLAAQQTQPVFRAATSLVPVDVRVTDRTGRPITDLTQADFIVFENNVRQQIRHFSTLMLSPDLTVDRRPLVRAAVSEPLGAQNARIFLIVLGRGRLQPPAKGVDGMIHFVRERLLPQDRVAVLAWNRATDFTTDHEAIATMLERFRRSHERVEADLAMAFSGLAAIYGSNEIPKHLQTSIDEVFGGPERAPLRTVTDAPIANAGRLADDQRRITDKLQRDEI